MLCRRTRLSYFQADQFTPSTIGSRDNDMPTMDNFGYGTQAEDAISQARTPNMLRGSSAIFKARMKGLKPLT